MEASFFYSPHYDFSFLGLDKLHPFYGNKYSKAWGIVSKTIGTKVGALWKKPDHPVSDEQLLQVHTIEYLLSLNSSEVVAKAMEFRLAQYFPNSILYKRILLPARFAVEGTIAATKMAIKGGISLNFGGGYHHAFPEHGEGFCIFADAALGIISCRNHGLLKQDDHIIMIDLDAHRGNGFEHIFYNDSFVHIFDMYNFQVYPGLHQGDPDDFPFMIPMRAQSDDKEYLDTLAKELPEFLNKFQGAKLAFYNAGTDIIEKDRLGGLKISFQGVVERDKYVLEQLVKRNIPTVIMTSGGYSKQSYKLIAQLGLEVFKQIDKKNGNDSIFVDNVNSTHIE